MGWKKKALDECIRHEIEFEDQTIKDEYRVVIRTIDPDRIILFTESQEYTVRKYRYPGSNKERLWVAVYDIVIGGTVPYLDWHNHISHCKDVCICQPYYPLAYYPED